MRALGPRFLVEAIFLVVVALVAGLAGLRWTAIVLVMALAYLLVVVFEIVVSRAGVFPGQDAFRRRREVEPPAVEPTPPMPEPQHVHVIPREPDPTAQPVLERRHEPEPEPELEAPPAPEPLPPALEPLLVEPTPEPDLPPVAPEPVPVPEPEPVPELERLVRAHTGDDVAVDEERSYLLVYLREFATPEGTLPVDFDGLVRESFGELLAPAR